MLHRKRFFFSIPKTSYTLVEREWALRISERNNRLLLKKLVLMENMYFLVFAVWIVLCSQCCMHCWKQKGNCSEFCKSQV